MHKNYLYSPSLKPKLVAAIFEFFIIALVVLTPIVTIYVDLVILKNNMDEISVTELTQESFLLISVLIYWFCVRKRTEMRGFLVLVAGFFTALFIRELDVYFDIIMHGFWFYVAMTTSLLSIFYVYFFTEKTTLRPLVEFIDTKSYYLLFIGMVLLLIFSRAFGSGTIFWNHIIDEHSLYIVKAVVQEGIELVGYTFIFYGSLLFLKNNYRK